MLMLLDDDGDHRQLLLHTLGSPPSTSEMWTMISCFQNIVPIAQDLESVKNPVY